MRPDPSREMSIVTPLLRASQASALNVFTDAFLPLIRTVPAPSDFTVIPVDVLPPPPNHPNTIISLKSETATCGAEDSQRS